MGLSNDFTGHILCSADTKRLLPRLEAEVERDRIVNGVREVSRKKYDKLRPKILDKGTKDERVVDRVVSFDVCLSTPTSAFASCIMCYG